MVGLPIGAVGFAAAPLLGLFGTSPTRAIYWQAQDSTGTPAQDSNGQPVFGPPLYPQVVVEEKHTDRLVLTRHPVEHGSQITDHAYKLPAQVQVRGGWSFSAGGYPTILPIPTDPSYLQSIYNTLLQIQIQRSFVTLVTGKRLYQYMLLETLEITTDPHTENVLSFTAIFEEVLMASTQTTILPDASVMKNPLANQATTGQGTTSLTDGTAVNTPALATPLPKLDLSQVKAAGSVVGTALGSAFNASSPGP